MPNPKCLCCQKNKPTEGPRVCPVCNRSFAHGWDGIDAHWRSKHEDILTYKDFWVSLCDKHRGNGGGKVLREEDYLKFLQQQGVGDNDKIASSLDSYLSYLHSVSKLLGQTITPELLQSEEDIARINSLLDGLRPSSTASNHTTAMRRYVEMVTSDKSTAIENTPPARYFVEQYWPEETRDLDDLYLWFHDKKLKRDAELNDGDRVLFYEVEHHPEKKVVGAKAIFASGTLTSERYYIPTDKQVSGGKRWVFGRRVDTDFAVTPKMGIPLAEAKKVLGISGWPQQGFELEKEQFELLV